MGRLVIAMVVLEALWAPTPATSADGPDAASARTSAACEVTVVQVESRTRSEQGVEEQVLKLEEEINTAVVSGDLRVFQRLLADDFTHTNQSGIFRTRAQWLANHKPGQSPYTAYEVDDLKIRVYGDTAVVTARTTPKGRDSKGNPITGQYRYLRVWARRDGRWQAVAFQSTRIAP
jgi:ketosteroid isomerase-like protein